MQKLIKGEQDWHVKINNSFAEVEQDKTSILNTIGSEKLATKAQNIKGAVNEVATQLSEKANQNDLLIERNRIDNFITLPEGSTIGDAELADSRIGADGVVYNASGKAIRKQFGDFIKFKENLWTGGNIEKSYTKGQTWVFTDINITNLLENVLYIFQIDYVKDIAFSNLCEITFYGTTDNKLGSVNYTTINDLLTFYIPRGTIKTTFRFIAVGGTASTTDSKAIWSGIKLNRKNDKNIINEDVSFPSVNNAIQVLKDKIIVEPYNLWEYSDVQKSYTRGQTWVYYQIETTMLQQNTSYNYKITSIVNNIQNTDKGAILFYNNTMLIQTITIYEVDKYYSFRLPENCNKVTFRFQVVAGTPALIDGIAYFKDIKLYAGETKIKLQDYLINKDKLNNTTSISKKFNLNSGETQSLISNNILKNNITSFNAKITTFDKILIGHGKTGFYGNYLEIDGNNIKVYAYTTVPVLLNTYTHSLTMADFIGININVKNNGFADIRLFSKSGLYEVKDIVWEGCFGDVFVESSNTSLTNCIFTWDCKDYKKDIWAFGDSYFSMSSTIRWTHYINAWGYDNWLVDSYPGRNSVGAYSSLLNNLEYYKPKYILWCLGMNDADNGSINTNWLNTLNLIKALCDSKGIELILSTIPNVPTRDNSYKNDYIKNSGYRYVDFEKAVNSDMSPNWFEGMLHTDGVHTAKNGAIALAFEVINKVPELTY